MPLPHTYRITQYDPRDRDPSGAYIGEVDNVSDEGPLEAAYLDAVEAFAREVGVTRLAVRDPSVSHSPEDTPYSPDDVLVQIFGPGLVGLYDGATIDIAAAREIVRGMLRGDGKRVWCLLEAEGQMAVSVGWDVYMFIATDRPCPAAVAATAADSLFPEDWKVSPHTRDDAELERWRTQHTPIDDAFWARIDELVRLHGGVLVEERAAWTRWHRVTAEGARPALRPRCLVWVWPDLTTDKAAVMPHLDTEDPDDVEGTVVWQSPDGRLHDDCLSAEELPRIRATLDAATRVWWRSDYADGFAPLIEAVNPDDDGVIRGRWEPLESLGT
ncbi:hypothetical protein [Cellulomonas sp. NS3]|uniref:hypothetical protein n=1 Tax=Cellulomonas sp. NS3 TaxID=2973977 RepID=UPI002162FC0D|nr:hypothetical protein [Cellulomonas sp. NS3]